MRAPQLETAAERATQRRPARRRLDLSPPAVWRLFRRAGWAPFAVLVAHRIVLVSDLRQYPVCDWLLHFSGGLAIAYFFFHLVRFLEPLLGGLALPARALLAATGGCTVAAAWELAEFAYSGVRGIILQHSLTETMVDLFNSCLGAALASACLALAYRRRAARRPL